MKESPKNIIALHNVSKTHKIKGEVIIALENISLNIAQGETIAITGPSGSGKSSLLHLMGCLDTPTRGEIIIDNTPTTELRDSALAKLRNTTIGFVFQFFYLQPNLNVADNIGLPAMFKHEKQDAIDARTHKLISSVNIAELADRHPSELSGGQIQRTAVARALMNNPKIILADEPTGNLDPESSEAVMQLLLAANREFDTTIIVATHDQAIANRMQRTIKLNHGVIQ